MFSTRKSCVIGSLIWGYQKFYPIPPKNGFWVGHGTNWPKMPIFGQKSWFWLGLLTQCWSHWKRKEYIFGSTKQEAKKVNNDNTDFETKQQCTCTLKYIGIWRVSSLKYLALHITFYLCSLLSEQCICIWPAISYSVLFLLSAVWTMSVNVLHCLRQTFSPTLADCRPQC